MLKQIHYLILVTFILSCTTSPTGRKQLKLISSEQMVQMGNQSFQQLKTKTKMSNSNKYNSYVRCISHRILGQIGEKPDDWEIKVFEDKSLNAFALPGNKIGIHTGMIEFAKNQDQLAAVIGHEIGHVKANHSNERISQEIVLNYGMQAVQEYIKKPDGSQSQYILAGLGLGSKFGVLLPFSRKHESEADLLGLEYMAAAGFNPKEAAELWRNMKAQSSKTVPEILSTHPSNETRISLLTEQAPRFWQDYQKNRQTSECK